MKRSTKHLIAQRVVALLAFVVFIGALKIWPFPLVSEWPNWVGLLALAVLFAAILSALGIGPWGRAVKASLTQENQMYHASLEPHQPWQSKHDV
jgi:hypothetical protein